MLTGPEEVSARPLPAVVIAFSLVCSAAFLHALTLEAPVPDPKPLTL